MTRSNRSVVITGAGAGIGKALARAFCTDGWFVIGIERDEAAALELDAMDVTITSIVGDITDDRILEKAQERARAHAPLECWINNAASTAGMPLLALDDTHIQGTFDANIRAAVIGSRLAVEEFGGRGGSIINISSIHSRLGFAGHAMYDLSKGAIDALTRSIAAEHGPAGVRCNAIAPGAVMVEHEILARAKNPVTRESIPRAMFSSPEEIAEIALFLASAKSIAINGAVIAADRGLSSVFVDEHWHNAPAAH